jgi:hypothetical protein
MPSASMDSVGMPELFVMSGKISGDFVFARVLNVIGSEESNVDPTQDAAWQRELNLLIAPHPDLTEGQRRAIELDYGMKSGCVVLKTREALLFYVLHLLGFDETGARRPQGQQIVLVNHEELQPFLGTRTDSVVLCSARLARYGIA